MDTSETSRTILVVDDHPVIAMSVEGLVEDLNHTAVTAYDPQGGIAALRKNPAISVLVTDLSFPKGNGIDFINEARALRPDLAVIAMTGHTDPELPEGVLLLPKPFGTDLFERVLSAAIALIPAPELRDMSRLTVRNDEAARAAMRLSS